MTELTHTQLRHALGSYLLGSLEPTERAAVEAHLVGCATCREELASFAALPALMSRVEVERVRGTALPVLVPPTVLGGALEAVAAERAATVTVLRRWRVGAVLSAAAAVVVVAVVLGVTTLQTQTATTTPGGVALVAAAGVTATGTAAVEAKPWGTAVTLQLQGLPQGGPFTAWVSAPDGTRALAATWSPTPDGHVVLTGAANIHDTTHAALQVTQDGTTLLTLPAHT